MRQSIRVSVIIAFALSILLHISSVVTLVKWVGDGTSPGNVRRTILVEVPAGKRITPQAPSTGAKTPSGSSTRLKSPKNLARQGLPLKALGLPVLQKSGEISPAAGGSIDRAEVAWGGSDGFSEARKTTLTQEGLERPWMAKLWRKIDAVLRYPDDFVQQRIEGTVYAQVEVDAQGRLKAEGFQVTGSEEFLQAYVATVLLVALKEGDGTEGPARKLALEFRFSVFGPGGSHELHHHGFFKNLFQFEKKAYVDPLLNQKLAKLVERYLPPIIPIPGGFYIDFIRAVQWVRNLNTPDPDDLRAQRLGIQLEAWRNQVVSKMPHPR